MPWTIKERYVRIVGPLGYNYTLGLALLKNALMKGIRCLSVATLLAFGKGINLM
jgi:hypothetical protein